MGYESGELLRAAVEERLRRKLSKDEWKIVDPDGSFTGPLPFDDADFDDLLVKVQRLPELPVTSPKERNRRTGLAHVRRVAATISSVVEQERMALFGHAGAPFANTAEAGAWIEAQSGDITEMHLVLEVDLPAREMRIEVIRDLKDWLDEKLAALDEGATLADFFRVADGLRSIDLLNADLPYLPAFDESVGTMGYKRARALPGSKLEQLLRAAERVAAATDWELIAAVHHLLTDGLMSRSVTATTGLRVSDAGGAHDSITLYVPYPSLVTAESVSAAYIEARETSRSGRSRARGSELGERLVAFVDAHPQLRTWRERRDRWNQESNGHVYPTVGAMGAAYRRARKRT